MRSETYTAIATRNWSNRASTNGLASRWSSGWRAWNVPIGRPNWTRLLARYTTISKALLARPRVSADWSKVAAKSNAGKRDGFSP